MLDRYARRAGALVLCILAIASARMVDAQICQDCLAADLDPSGTPVVGHLTDDDCSLGNSTRFDPWALHLDEAAEITVNLRSSDFDTFLILVDENCETIAGNDNCVTDEPPGSDSCFVADLAAGDDFVLANSFERDTFGEYEISATSAPITTCEDSLDGAVECDSHDFNDECGPGENPGSCLELDLPAGEYFIGVNAYSAGESGGL